MRSGVPVIRVLAGANGAGKSSIGGAALRREGAGHYDADRVTRSLLARVPTLSDEAANIRAWRIGRRLLTRAIVERKSFAFETTLGGRTITRLLSEASQAGMAVDIWYVGLKSPELHIQRVAERVAAGGHAIPEERIRQRYDSSRLNLIPLMPDLRHLWIYDNSAPGDPKRGRPPRPDLILEMLEQRIVRHCELRTVPDWAKPIVAAALRLDRR